MNKQQYPSIYPCRNQLWIWLSFGIIMLGATIGSLYCRAWLPAMMFLGFDLLQVHTICGCTTRVTLTPWGVEVYRLGKLLDMLPAEEMHLFLAEGLKRRGNPGLSMIYIAPCDTDELIRLQIQRLKKQRLSPEAIAARKQQPDWRRTFATEALHGLSRKRKGAAISLRNTADTQALLKYCYPNKSPISLLLRKPCSPKASCQGSKSFRRGVEDAWKLPLTIAVFLAVPMALFGLLSRQVWWVWLMLYGIVLLLAGLWVGKERERICPTPEGIEMTGWRKRTIPAGEIKTIARVGAMGIYDATDYLVVSTLTPEEITRREQQRLRRSRWGRKFMAMYAGVPDWQACCLFRWCGRKLTRWSYWGQEPLMVLHHPDRERLLRRMYPHAQWLESPEGTN